MRKFHALILATGMLAVVGSLALAQRGGGFFRGPSPMMLLGQESVQKELKLTPEQVEKTKAALDKQGKSFQGLRGIQDEQERAKKFEEMRKEADKTIAEILKPDQAKRLKQITLQQQGGRAFDDPEVAKELSLTGDQKNKVKEIMEDTGSQIRELFQGGGGFSEETRKKMQEINSAATEKVMGLLTADQKAKWKEITGEPFKGEIRFGPPGGGQRKPAEKKQG
jgi:Spy/CpxP family protein refolding chaperone